MENAPLELHLGLVGSTGTGDSLLPLSSWRNVAGSMLMYTFYSNLKIKMRVCRYTNPGPIGIEDPNKVLQEYVQIWCVYRKLNDQISGFRFSLCNKIIPPLPESQHRIRIICWIVTIAAFFWVFYSCHVRVPRDAKHLTVWIHSRSCFKTTQILEICATWKYVFKHKRRRRGKKSAN